MLGQVLRQVLRRLAGNGCPRGLSAAPRMRNQRSFCLTMMPKSEQVGSKVVIHAKEASEALETSKMSSETCQTRCGTVETGIETCKIGVQTDVSQHLLEQVLRQVNSS